VTGLRPFSPDAEFIEFQQAVAGHYSLERELGRGGMGIVFLAREMRLARPVAIKVLPRALALAKPELRERFVREAQMAAQLAHPNIVPIHHVDEAGEFVYFVMTYIEGETLGERLRSKGALTPMEAARVFRDVGWALAYAHVRGIVHRDVKPDNILIERNTGRALVTDFGIAGDVETASPADGGYIRGTVHYLSPEQAAGANVDGRSDLYSLGVTAYYALTGKLPFDASSATGVMIAHATKRARPIVEVASHVPHKLADAVERCLEKLPERRWPNGEKFAEAVDAAFEAPRELPAPLRAWLTQGDRLRGFYFVIGVYSLAGVIALAASGYVFAAIAVLTAASALIGLPLISTLRRLISSGFALEDIRGAVATHVMRKKEELEYEAGAAFALTPKRLAIIATVFGSLAAAGAIGLWLFALPTSKDILMGPIVMGVVLAIISAGLALARKLQLSRFTGWFGSPRLGFWRSKWGERLYRLASRGMQTPVGKTALSQHTEVALGRALDSLFASLPKATRKELKDVPETVRRLEGEARKLRESLDAVDAAIAAAERAERPGEARDLEREREVLSSRLASTVTALETIRLGLLRLQLGAAPVATVTEALEAASRLGYEIDLAQRDVSAALKPLRAPRLSARPEAEKTPV
jgi:predicted Ser/Thr protein kinase